MLEKPLDPRFTRSRLALLAAMTALLDERDVAQISITDVVARAQVSRPTFYQHFSDVPAIARRAFFMRLEEAFPATSSDERPASQSLHPIAETARVILDHMMTHSAFYLRVLAGAGTVELFDDLVSFLEDRLIVESPLGPAIQASSSISPSDRGTILAGGIVWLVMRWLHSDFEGRNTPAEMAMRIARSLSVLSADNS